MSQRDLESIDEELTAYLDGELSSQEANDLERRLVEDEPLRLRLAELRKAYDWLDELPETPHDQRFTRSTLEMVVKDLSASIGTTAELEKARSPKRSFFAQKREWWRWPYLPLTLSACMLCGCTAGLMYRFAQVSQDFRDLGLIASMPGLLDVRDFDTAVKVAEQKEAIELIQQEFKDKLVPPPPASTWERRAWVQELGPLQVAKLDAGRESLRKLDRDESADLASVQKKIEEHPNSQQIQEAVHVIGFVLDKLPNPSRLDLESFSPEQRADFLKEQVCLTASMLYATKMSDEDEKAISEWERKILREVVLYDLQMEQIDNREELYNRLWARRLLERGFQLERQQALITQLQPTLSLTAQRLLEGLNKNDQLSVLVAWILPNRISSNQTLLDQYEAMPREDRERIDLSSPQQTRRTIDETRRRSLMRRGPMRPDRRDR
jgi:hypothetical protein